MAPLLLHLSCLFSISDPAPPPASINLFRTYTIKDIVQYNDRASYTDRDCAFQKEDDFICVHPLHPAAQAGEMQFCSPRTGKVTRLKIPQPIGFKPKFDFDSYFEDEGIWVNQRGDCFLQWMLTGNGDHGMALFSKDLEGFVTQRSELSLMTHRRAISSPDGSWYYLTWKGDISVYAIDDKARIHKLGSHDGLGHHLYGVVDACFRSNDVLHFVYAEVDTDNHVHFRTVNFNIAKKTWTPRQTIGHVEEFVGSAKPTVMMLQDKSLHYFWSIDTGQERTAASGLYYLADGKKAPIRLSPSIHGCKVIAQGAKIVVCYTLERQPNIVFFRVLQSGTPGPEVPLKIANDRKYNLWSEYMVLGSAGKDLVWFVNTQAINTFYELRIAPVARQDPKKARE